MEMPSNLPKKAKEPGLHPSTKLMVADPKVIAENLIYELEHGEKDVLGALMALHNSR